MFGLDASYFKSQSQRQLITMVIFEFIQELAGKYSTATLANSWCLRSNLTPTIEEQMWSRSKENMCSEHPNGRSTPHHLVFPAAKRLAKELHNHWPMARSSSIKRPHFVLKPAEGSNYNFWLEQFLAGFTVIIVLISQLLTPTYGPWNILSPKVPSRFALQAGCHRWSQQEARLAPCWSWFHRSSL